MTHTTPAAHHHHHVDVEYLTPNGPSKFPFSPAVRVADMLYLSGQIGLDAKGKLVPGGIEAETKQTMENIAALLEQIGSSIDRVVSCTVMLTDMNEWAAMNGVYATFFPGHKPTRSAFGVTALALGACVEIECAAVRG
jgi:2-iminobutanoate/2-iminopropanoate deaminase